MKLKFNGTNFLTFNKLDPAALDVPENEEFANKNRSAQANGRVGG